MTRQEEPGRLVVLVADRDIEEALAELFRRPTALGWGRDYDALRRWLEAKGLWDDGISKPGDPKTAVSRALRSAPPTSRRRRSARLYGEIAAGVSLEGCQDPAFLKLRRILQEWFPKAEQ